LGQDKAGRKIAVGCDHRGYPSKRELLPLLQTLGFRIEDFGCHNVSGVDYPDIAYPVAVAVASRQCELGILIDCNGIGMNMVANKVPGVRAATVHDEFTARCARENYHCNVIGIGADWIIGKDIRKIVEVFLLAAISEGRHARRVEKLRQIEEMQARIRPVPQNPVQWENLYPGKAELDEMSKDAFLGRKDTRPKNGVAQDRIGDQKRSGTNGD
jgi:ribose 5-phosphate isomerase B